MLAHAGAADESLSVVLLFAGLWVGWIGWSRLKGRGFPRLPTGGAVVLLGVGIALAIGAAGDVYLCHPFLVHAAQRHRGATPKFMAQPPLQPARPIALDRADGDYSPVETAIRIGLGLQER